MRIGTAGVAIAVGVALAYPSQMRAQTETEVALEITLEHDSEAERGTRDLLESLVERYEVSEWVFTTRIHVDETVIPHSHPVLTVDTDSSSDEMLLSTFLHEQFHWMEEERHEARDATMARFAEMFPDAPGREGNGARDQQSTYLHLIVCDLEFQAMTILIGEEAARDLLASITHYEWIYDKVLNDPRVREVNREMGMVVPLSTPR